MYNKFLIVILLALSVTPLSIAFAEETPGGFWDMNNSSTWKDILVPIASEPNYPAAKTSQNREVLENPNGDVVFGLWSDESNAFVHNPRLQDNALLFEGGQTAYIENIFTMVTNFKISFDFKADNVDTLMDMFDVFGSWNIRVEPGDEDKGRVRFYKRTVLPETQDLAWRSTDTDFVIESSQWYNVEASVYEDRGYLKLDGVDVDPQGTELETGLRTATHPNLFMGSRWDGDRRHFSGSIDNIQITYYEDTCGAWGYHPFDFNLDCFVSLADFAYFAGSWLECTDPELEGCVVAK
jgi:hypothetical protein